MASVIPIPAWHDLIVCGVSPVSTTAPIADSHHMCTFADLITVTNAFIQDLIILSTIATTLILLWAGIRLLTAVFNGNTNALREAKGMLLNVLIGYVWIIAGWVVVYTILHALVDPSYWLLG